jgi:ADP-heptose:LPS heptosyltransferase
VLLSRGGWRRLAVLRPGRIGDYLCATPAVRALRRALPGAELHYVALPLVRELVERNPSVDRFVAFPGFPYVAEQFFDARRAVRWLLAAQEERYDLVLQLYGSGVYTNPIALLMGGRHTAGFVRPGDHAPALSAALPLPTAGPEVDRVLALVRHLGAPDAGRGYELVLSGTDRAAAAGTLAGLAAPVLGLHCGARDEPRRLPPEGYVRAAALLHARYGGSAVVLGGEDERPVAGRLAAALAAAGVPGRNLAGELSLAGAAAVIAGLDALLTTDSGPAHLAYATGTRSVTVFPASDPERWGPPAGGPHALLDAREGAPPAEAMAAAVDEVLTRRSPAGLAG